MLVQFSLFTIAAHQQSAATDIEPFQATNAQRLRMPRGVAEQFNSPRSSQQAANGNLRDRNGERRANTCMSSAAENQRASRRTVEIINIRPFEHGLVAVGRRKKKKDHFAGFDARIQPIKSLLRDSRSQLIGHLKTPRFKNCARQQLGSAPELRKLIRVPQQANQRVADQILSAVHSPRPPGRARYRSGEIGRPRFGQRVV